MYSSLQVAVGEELAAVVLQGVIVLSTSSALQQQLLTP
jgi:hypothetical protein